MDRNKPGSSGRSSKKQINLPQSELFALGSVPERKRDAVGMASAVAAKKIKLATASGSAGGGSSSGLTASLPGSSKASSGGDSSSSSSVLEYWEQMALDCESVDLVSSVLSAIDQQDSDSVVGYICGAIKLLISPKSKSESVLSLSLLYLAKIRPHLFCNETITSALIAVLKRDSQNSFKGRNNPTVHVLACNLLARGYSDKKQWPESLIRTYVEDATNDRVWVDYEECAPFTDQCVAAFGSKIPPKWMLQPELSTLNPTSRENPIIDDEHSTDSGMFGDALGKDPDANPPRFAHIQETVEKLVVEAAKDQLNRRQAPDCSTRNFLKFLSLACGIPEVRALAIPRLELWIHNGKLMKPAQELLTFICYNVTGQNSKDHEVLSNLVKMRLKTKPLINIFMICLKEMINCQSEILTMMLKYVVQNELSNARNPNNMGMLATMFQAKPTESATHLAEIYQECLLQREDVLRTLRVFLRELVKMLRYDIPLMVFCKALLTNRADLTAQVANSEFRDRIFHSVADLICLCMFLSVSPQIREANASIRSGREPKSSPALTTFYQQMSTIQFDALTWMHEIVPLVFKPSPNDFKLAFHKILLLDPPEAYAKGDQWPPEPERAPLLRMVSEIPLQQNSMLRIILIGITKEIPFTVPDTMEIIEQLVRRAGSLRHIDYPPLEVANLEIIDLLFKMSEYHHPDNIVLPQNYEPPNLAISSLYWKTWIILLLISAHNPAMFGSFCWEQYPMLRTLMEMCITNQIGPTKPSDEELQVATAEKAQILEFENHLASNAITEQNSLLLSQLILMDPRGVARRPPNQVLEQIQTLNQTLKIGHLLCRSRKPDLLLEIIQRQGTSQMPWLADLVQNSDGDFNHLPVQCLCEFLLSNSATVIVESSREADLLIYLQKVIQDETGEHQIICEILEYFLRRLSSFSKQSRQSAIRGLKLLLKVFQEDNDPVPIESNNSDWLLRYLPTIPHFVYVRPNVVVQLRAACQVENIPELVMVYIQFIAAHTSLDSEPDMLEHVMDMSHLIVERSTIFSHIIPTVTDQSETRVQTLNCLFVMFNNFLIKLREYKITQAFTEYPDLLLVQFADETQCHIHLNIIQGFVILLTHSAFIPMAAQILDYWFPEGAPPPQAFTIDTSEPVQILPDWLKLKMIRSNVDRLVDAALIGLTPDQIVLFVQNFGTPINSMSKLLALLDRAVIEQFEAVNSAILHKKYLAQLVEIQQARGAKNGHISIQALELDNQSIGDPPMMTVAVMQPMKVDFGEERVRTISEQSKPASKGKEIEEAVEIILTHPVISQPNMAKYRKLIQRLMVGGKSAKSQEYTANKVLNYLGRLVKSSQGQYLVKNWVQNPQMCCFFRSLLEIAPEKFENLNYLLHVLDEIIKFMNPAPNTVLLQILVGKRAQLIKVAQKDTFQTQSQSQNLLQVLSTTKSSEVEKKGKQQLRQTDSDEMINVISTMLKNWKGVKSESASAELQYDKRGLLVDWLAEADSELVHVNKEQQMDMLFNKALPDFRPYLLSLMSHQVSWATLHQTVEVLMEKFNPSYDPCSVLDFIDTLTRNPKLWQGRDKAVPKHEQAEYVVMLSEGQVRTFIDYVLAEEDRDKMSQRVKLLVQSISSKYDYLNSMVEYADGKNDPASKLFLQHLYLNIPPMKFLMPHVKAVYDADVRNEIGCVGDKFSYYILTTIACLSNPRDFQQMSAEMELIVRKLAASHPVLLLRQLSVLATLLQGRAHMDLQVLRAEYHFHLFHLVMGILELLQPLVFEDSYSVGLQNALDCYFALLRNHGNVKETYTLIYRFMEFLQAYIAANPKSATIFIQQYFDLLNDLAQQHYDLQSLQQLVQGLSMLKQRTPLAITEPQQTPTEPTPGTSKDVKKPTPDQHQSATAVMMTPYVKNEILPQHWLELTHALRSRDIDDISMPLLEVDALTVKRPALLEDVFDDVIRFLTHHSGSIRQTAHSLVTRWLKQNPGNFSTNSTALTAFVGCLYHEDVAVVQSALDKTTEYVLCLQEYAPQILVTLFNLGIGCKINTYTAIRRCVLAVKKQHAC